MAVDDVITLKNGDRIVGEIKKLNKADLHIDPEIPAFYYVRVIEIPTPRWTAYDAKRFGVEIPGESPMTTTERAYTTPIWYNPE